MQSSFEFIHQSRFKWVLSLSYGLFLYVFLLAFLPFGVSNYNPNHQYTYQFLTELGKFVPVTVIASLVNEFWLKRFFQPRKDAGFFILWSLWSFVYLGLVIFITYNYLGNWHDWKVASLPGFLFNTATVLLFPAIGVFFFFRYQSLQNRYNNVLLDIDTGIDPSEMIHFIGEGANDRISITVTDFIYARAQDNYTELFYDQNGILKKYLIRSSLGKLFSTIKQDFLVRCHRSYLVNLYGVHSIHGGRGDMRLAMKQTEQTIPVSRTYSESTLSALRKYKRFE